MHLHACERVYVLCMYICAPTTLRSYLARPRQGWEPYLSFRVFDPTGKNALALSVAPRRHGCSRPTADPFKGPSTIVSRLIEALKREAVTRPRKRASL